MVNNLTGSGEGGLDIGSVWVDLETSVAMSITLISLVSISSNDWNLLSPEKMFQIKEIFVLFKCQQITSEDHTLKFLWIFP